MIIGIGMDLVEVERIRSLLRRHPNRALARLFTGEEVEDCSGKRERAESLAARFAAKEALFKALGTGWSNGIAWRDVEIVTDSKGAPRVRLYGIARRVAEERGVDRAHVTLSHTRELAAAYIVLEGDPVG